MASPAAVRVGAKPRGNSKLIRLLPPRRLRRVVVFLLEVELFLDVDLLRLLDAVLSEGAFLLRDLDTDRLRLLETVLFVVVLFRDLDTDRLRDLETERLRPLVAGAFLVLLPKLERDARPAAVRKGLIPAGITSFSRPRVPPRRLPPRFLRPPF